MKIIRKEINKQILDNPNAKFKGGESFNDFANRVIKEYNELKKSKNNMKEYFDQLSNDFSKKITRKYSTSFSLGILFLNKKK